MIKQETIMIPRTIITRIKNDPIRVYLLLRLLGTLTTEMLTKKDVAPESIDELITHMLNGMEEQVVNIQKLDIKEEEIN